MENRADKRRSKEMNTAEKAALYCGALPGLRQRSTRNARAHLSTREIAFRASDIRRTSIATIAADVGSKRTKAIYKSRACLFSRALDLNVGASPTVSPENIADVESRTATKANLNSPCLSSGAANSSLIRR